MPTLADLDKAFTEIWLHPEQIHTLLEDWQDSIKETIAEFPNDDDFIQQFEGYMARWNEVLSENRTILLEHQKTLKTSLKQGEPRVSAEKIAKKFKN